AKPLPDDILGIDRSQSKVYGPYYAATGCFGRDQDGNIYNYPFYVAEKNFGEETSVKPMLTNTKYYRDYHDISKRSQEDLLVKRGILIRPHPETNDYMCTDLRFYLNLIEQYLTEKGLINNANEDNGFATLPYIIANA